MKLVGRAPCLVQVLPAAAAQSVAAKPHWQHQLGAVRLLPAISTRPAVEHSHRRHLSAKLWRTAPLWTCLLDGHCNSPRWLAGGERCAERRGVAPD